MTDLPAGRFGAILADPAWRFATRSPKGEAKSPQRHYECMSLAEISALPVADVAADDCALFLWATFPMLPHALLVMARWGFIYKTGGAWAKRSSADASWAFGPGFIFRGASELLLVGTRGQPKWRSRSERNLWVAPVREHSRKPDEVHAMIERTAAAPFLELFSRESRPGWTAWGDQVGRFDAANETVDEIAGS